MFDPKIEPRDTGTKFSLTWMCYGQDVMPGINKKSICTPVLRSGRLLSLSARSCFIPGSRDRDGTEQHASG